jgi:MFS family permease
MFIVINTIPMRERPRLLAIFFALQSIAFTAGPTLSGILTDSYLTVRNTIQRVFGSQSKRTAFTNELSVSLF